MTVIPNQNWSLTSSEALEPKVIELGKDPNEKLVGLEVSSPNHIGLHNPDSQRGSYRQNTVVGSHRSKPEEVCCELHFISDALVHKFETVVSQYQ